MACHTRKRDGGRDHAKDIALPATPYRVEQKKVPAKFSDTCSARADRLCIGWPKLVVCRKAGNSNMQEFYFSTL